MAQRLPVEIWWAIGEEIDNTSDLASLAQVCTQLHRIINPQLYRLAAQSVIALKAIFWGVSHGMHSTVNYCIAGGINPNIIWHSKQDAKVKIELVPTLEECVISFESAITVQDETWDHRPRYWSPIHIAAMFDDLPMVQLLLSHGARPDLGSFGACPCYHLHDYTRRVRSSFIYFPWARFPSWTPYHVAICTGSLEVGEYFMNQNVDTDMECFEWYPSRPRTGMTPFHVAALTGNVHLLRMLMERKGTREIEKADARGATPLVFACYHGNWECASILLQHGANINRVCTRQIEQQPGHVETYSTTILADTLESSRFEDCLRLLELGSDPRISDRARQGRLPLIHQLCMDSWDRGYWDYNGTTTRQVRTEAQAISGLKLLDHFIKEGLDFRQSAREHLDFGAIHNTALCFAAASANLAAVKRLIEAGADVDGDPQQDIMTPMARACNVYNGPETVAMVTMLIEAGASVNRVRDNTKAPLWMLWDDVNIDAAQQELRKTLTDLLLKHGSNPGRGTDHGDIAFTTALDSRLLQKDFAGFEDLRARSVPSLDDDDFLGFWDVAVRMEDPEVVRYVIEDDTEGVIARRCRTALAYLLTDMPHETDLITTLLDRGANPNATCANDTPLSYVLSRTTWPIPRKELILKTLLDAGASIHRRPQHPPIAGLDDGDTLYRDITPLDLAIQGLDGSAKFLEMMLEMQPLRDDSEIDAYRYISEACEVGNFRALSAIINSSEHAHRTMRENASTLLHHLLDCLLDSTTMRHVNATVDCLQLLLENGVDLSAPLPEDVADERMAKQKLLGYMSLDDSPQCSDKDRALAWCLRQKIHFTDNDDAPSFKPETTALFFQLHTSLDNLGKILGSDSRRYHIVSTGS